MSVLALVSVGAFGIWGVAAVAGGTLLAILSHPFYGGVLPELMAIVGTVVRLVLVMIIVQALLVPFTPDRLKARVPVIVLATVAVQLALSLVALMVAGRFGMALSLVNVSLLINVVVQILLGYFVVIPAWKWLLARGTDGALADIQAHTGQAIKATREVAVQAGSDMKTAAASRAEKRKPKTDGGGYAVADWGVPHCNYEKTDTGFIVTFNKTHVGFHGAIDSASQPRNAVGAVGSLAALSAIGVAWAVHKSTGGTRIEVTGDAVIINDKKMSRDDFGGFNVDHTFKGGNASQAVATLGYQFGNRTFPFGGAWVEKQAAEVASSLNSHLRSTPRTGDEMAASPEMLRASRPTDF